jgi:SOS-response transcriptional repressor LexA
MDYRDWLLRRCEETSKDLTQVAALADLSYSYLWRLANSHRERYRHYKRPSYQAARAIGRALGAEQESLTVAGYAPEGSDPKQAQIRDSLAEVQRQLTTLLGRLGDETLEARHLPVYGPVPAGGFKFIEDHPSAHVHWPVEMNHIDFLLDVDGDSMAPKIESGDRVGVRRSPTAENNDIVVVRVEDVCTLKRYFREGRRVRLRPENPAYAETTHKPDEVAIIGVVSMVVKRV